MKRSRNDGEEVEEEEEERMESSSSSSSSSSSAAPATKQMQITARLPTSLCTMNADVLRYLMKSVQVDDLKNILFVNKFLKGIVCSYLEQLLMKSTFSISEDFSNLNGAWKMLAVLPHLPNYDPNKKVTLKLGKGVYEVVGSFTNPAVGTYQQMLSVPCTNLSIVGGGQGKTTVHGGLVAENGNHVSIIGLTVMNPRGSGLVALGVGTKMEISRVTIKECQNYGVYVREGAKFDGTGCHFYQNRWSGVFVAGSTTTARLTNCTSHHNKDHGVYADNDAVVDLMGEQTSVHDNERDGLAAYERGSTINVYQPCILNDMSHGNKRQNIYRGYCSRVQQKNSKK